MRAVPRTLPQIDKIVVLMVENRSLDNVLGWLHPPGSNVTVLPAGSLPNHFDGIPPDAANEANGVWYRPRRGFAHLGQQRWRAPRWDPHEGIADVHVQLYGGSILDSFGGHWPPAAPMAGFAEDFPAGRADGVGEVMGAYTADELPVLYGLARQFAVSDRWFASMPTETDPNRAFALCGTAEGDEYEVPARTFGAPTMFEALNPSADGVRAGRSWGIYWRSEGRQGFAPAGECYTVGRFTGVQRALEAPNSSGRVAPYTDLLDALAAGDDIPDFCWVEPAWGWGWGLPDGGDFVGLQGTDYHPPTWVGPAEWALDELYRALRGSRHWSSMLFVVLFDEHGGTYDHVGPPLATNPDGCTTTLPVPFDYRLFGPRVPAIVVSPFVAPGTVFRPPVGSAAPFDHTSLIKTVLAWADADPRQVAALGERVAAAPVFDWVLASTLRQPAAPLGFDPPAAFRDQCPLGYRLPFDGYGLTRDHHQMAATGATTLGEYLAALAQLVEPRP